MTLGPVSSSNHHTYYPLEVCGCVCVCRDPALCLYFLSLLCSDVSGCQPLGPTANNSMQAVRAGLYKDIAAKCQIVRVHPRGSYENIGQSLFLNVSESRVGFHLLARAYSGRCFGNYSQGCALLVLLSWEGNFERCVYKPQPTNPTHSAHNILYVLKKK